MNGPEHYALAEQLLERLAAWTALLEGVLVAPTVAASIQHAASQVAAVAQVHATLAVAAATAQQVLGAEGNAADAWVTTISTRTKPAKEPR